MLVSCTLGAAVCAAPQLDVATPSLSAQQTQQILALGPWPPPVRRDAGNRVSGDAKAIELGRQLFRDPRMSPVGYIACVTCHQPDRAFTDIKARAHGLADLPRNTPALANLGLQHWYGWGGASDSLWMASIKPILDAREFNGNAALVTRLFSREPDLAACYRRVFGVSPLSKPERTVVNVGKALAAYVETLVTARTPFDDLRDALARGDVRRAVAAYPPAALRGLQLFVGRGGCVSCHSGPNFSDGDFHPGVAPGDDMAAAVARTLADDGRLGDARYLKASRFNLQGAYNDDTSRRNANATRRLAVHASLAGQFRTPTLRNVAVTAPYFHNGQTESLIDAVQHAQRAGAGAAPAPLARADSEDLVAFLATLTDAHGSRRPWNPAGLTRCP
ncbi:MAG TPA: cytochrome c peroxidase [Burkholderiaceae bacterium]|nr:cytochrome c peroxidase [Burkholderiaceae bacterium]